MRMGTRIVAIDVKSGRRKESLPGAAFDRAFLRARNYLVGSSGIAIEEFVQIPLHELFA